MQHASLALSSLGPRPYRPAANRGAQQFVSEGRSGILMHDARQKAEATARAASMEKLVAEREVMLADDHLARVQCAVQQAQTAQIFKHVRPHANSLDLMWEGRVAAAAEQSAREVFDLQVENGQLVEQVEELWGNVVYMRQQCQAVMQKYAPWVEWDIPHASERDRGLSPPELCLCGSHAWRDCSFPDAEERYDREPFVVWDGNFFRCRREMLVPYRADPLHSSCMVHTNKTRSHINFDIFLNNKIMIFKQCITAATKAVSETIQPA